MRHALSGTNTDLATMSRLPVAAMPSTCHVSFTSTSPMGTRNIRDIGASSPGTIPDKITQSAWTTPVPYCHCPDSSKPPSRGFASPDGFTVPGARMNGCAV